MKDNKTRVAKLDNGRWVVEFLGYDGWGSFEDQPDHATKREAQAEMKQYEAENARDAAAQRLYLASHIESREYGFGFETTIL